MKELPKLHLHVKSIYFAQIKAGTKTNEYRSRNPYWTKRLAHEHGQPKDFSAVVIHNAYKPGKSNRLEFPWNGWHTETITHPHFGELPVNVFAIHLIPAS